MKRQLKRGDVVQLGSYPQTREGKRLPVRWRVLDIGEHSALLLSECALDGQPLFQPDVGAEPLKWPPKNDRTFISEAFCRLAGKNYADSWMCRWLNGSFLQSAFTEDERKLLLDAKEGKVFLLGPDDINNAAFFPTERSIACRATPWAKRCILGRAEAAPQDANGRVSWWLRSEATPFAVHGGRGGFAGTVYVELDASAPLAVRPAIRLNMDAWRAAF